ncbi:hypothetical protein BTR23_21645 [Alkalihalophilus pseudofirmus]|uniref:VrrA/YqfQ family protein n=1 Tax=Alkalihalobacterium alkalinitrilicum TaxID=427920 RepID=UPI00094CA6EC|nr:VrrA/YqfQ family protein [Alkalihalobacterium alkalinitrilicum]OLO26968.1 hypothetical protein BTR23_21645 [Alkalihalophilus pseudofirmus]
MFFPYQQQMMMPPTSPSPFNFPFFNSTPSPGMFGMASGAPNMMTPGGGGGLLARLFGRGAAGLGSSFGPGASMVGGMGAPMSGIGAAGTGALGGGMNLMGILQNAQRVMGIVQQVTPMIQQYGPLLRSMPQIYQILKNNPDSDETPSTLDHDNTQTTELTVNAANSSKRRSTKAHQLKKATVAGMPAPKMYI